MSSEFDTKSAKFLKEEEPLKFNGAIISRDKQGLSVTQPGHIKNLPELDVKNGTKSDYVAERARSAYIAAICRPDATYAFSIASQITEPQQKGLQKISTI